MILDNKIYPLGIKYGTVGPNLREIKVLLLRD